MAEILDLFWRCQTWREIDKKREQSGERQIERKMREFSLTETFN